MNQIDYIICKNVDKVLFNDSSLYREIPTPADHKLVKAIIKMDWWKIRQQFNKSERFTMNKSNWKKLRNTKKIPINTTTKPSVESKGENPKESRKIYGHKFNLILPEKDQHHAKIIPKTVYHKRHRSQSHQRKKWILHLHLLKSESIKKLEKKHLFRCSSRRIYKSWGRMTFQFLNALEAFSP